MNEQNRVSVEHQETQARLQAIQEAQARLRTAIGGTAAIAAAIGDRVVIDGKLGVVVAVWEEEDVSGQRVPVASVRYDYADLRDEPPTPGLPEAAALEGIPYLEKVSNPNGRQEVVLREAPPGMIRRFLEGEIVPELVDLYFDPVRRLAGGYLP